MATVTAEDARTAGAPWGSCPSAQAAEADREGNHLPCCVHVSDDGLGSAGHHVSFFCCWCGTAAPATDADLPPRASSSRRHGPIARGCRPARAADVHRAGR